ncbi:MAG: alpha/beta hydrolase [Chitinophagales bacterium]|nr:alpha/beta hydrolase [Chitinophagales bacterium]
MNWRVHLVLLFTSLRKPLDPKPDADISKMRRLSDRAARLGSLLYDSKTPIALVKDASADGVPVRIYKDSKANGQRVMIYYHGGGFVLYGLDSHDRVCRRLCKMNDCIVVSVDYRLAPEHTFPAAHEDAFTAIQWVRANIEKYGGDSSKLILIGDSAGGNLAACMAHKCKRGNIPLLAQILNYPWIDGKLNNPSIDKNGKGYLLEKETMFWFQQQYTPKKEDQCKPSVSPCYENDFANLAPAFILTAEFDPLVDDGFNYYEQLKAADNRVLYKEYPQLIHGFFSIPGVSKEAMQAYRDIKEFLSAL